MAFDKNLDEIIFEESLLYDDDKKSLDMKVCRYNNGPKKVQITRTIAFNGEDKVVKSGRLTKDEFKWLASNASKVLNILNE